MANQQGDFQGDVPVAMEVTGEAVVAKMRSRKARIALCRDRIRKSDGEPSAEETAHNSRVKEKMDDGDGDAMENVDDDDGYELGFDLFSGDAIDLPCSASFGDVWQETSGGKHADNVASDFHADKQEPVAEKQGDNAVITELHDISSQNVVTQEETAYDASFFDDAMPLTTMLSNNDPFIPGMDMDDADEWEVEDVLKLPAYLPTQKNTTSSSRDSLNLHHTTVDESAVSCMSTCNDHNQEEYKHNHFSIIAEASSLESAMEKDAEAALGLEQNDKHTHIAQILEKAEEYSTGEICQRALDLKDSALLPTVQDPELMNGKGDTSTTARIAEAQSFLNNIKQKSKTRLKILEVVSPPSSLDIKADSEHLKTELEIIQKLDMKLQQLESVEPSTCSFRYPLSSNGSKGIPTAVLYLRDERKRWKRQLLLKRTLEKLDPIENQNYNKHILRNVRLGPRARYFSLTQEEEALVKDLLLRPDFVEEETAEGNSTSSSISTAFDLEGEDALRMAEIDEKLEQFIEIHSACGSPSLTSVTLSVPKQHSMCSQNSNGVMRTPSIESNATGQNEVDSRAISFSTSVEDYLSEKKESREHQAKVENIDKRLRELIVGEIPTKLTKEQLAMLVSQCMMEQNLEVTMRPFLCIKT